MSISIRDFDGGERQLSEARVEGLGAEMRGRLIQAQDTDFEEACQIWNGMIARRPALIAECAGAADVLAAVRFAASERLLT